MRRTLLLRKITEFYFNSGDFNGITARTLEDETGSAWSQMRTALKGLVEDDLIGILYGDMTVNSHVLRTGYPTKKVQIDGLATDDLDHTCLYPRPDHLRKVVDQLLYVGRPYTLCLALGEPQLAYRAFDLSVLEFYRNDPRYYYNNNDIQGHVYSKDQDVQTADVRESDSVSLLRFGFAYDDDMNRAVAAFIYDLSDLTPEHQQIWKAKELKGEYLLHPDYYRATEGIWPEKLPILTAFVLELYYINQMAKATGREPLFNTDYGEYGEGRPTKLTFLVRPTLEEFNDFVLLLDKLLSDNINKKFFRNEVPTETETTRSDGKTVVQQKGTLQILDDWMRANFRPYGDNWGPWNDSIKAIRDVRTMRQKPAHAINENVFDQEYFQKQRDLVIRAYTAVRTLRLLMTNPSFVGSAKIKLPAELFEGKIWSY